MRGKTTIKDIARETGLSTTSISLVLNKKPNKISDSSRRRIIDAANRLNYYPNQQAVSLVNRQTKTIAQIIPDISNMFFGQLIQGSDSVAHPHGYSLILGTTNNDPARELDMIHSLCARGVDGVLLTTSSPVNARVYQDLFPKLDVPFVLVDRALSLLPCSSLTYDHQKGAYLATRHLIELGHKKIACISGAHKSGSADIRVKGFCLAMEDACLPLQQNAILYGDYSDKTGYDMADAVFDSGFTAVFCLNDMIAFGLYKRAGERGVRIPADLSVVGFDDVAFSTLINPALTTVRQSAYELGRESVKRIIMEIEQQAPRQTVYFEPVLMVRNSTCPPKN